MQEESKEKSKDAPFESLRILSERWKNGTFSEIINDWKWIFGYSARYKGAIVFYTILGILSTSLGLVSSVAGKYLIDIITGYQMQKLPLLLCIMIGSTVFSLGFESVINRISTKLGIAINNDIQADIFDKIVDADWLEISKYANGDVLNRFNGDIGTVSGNAISWLPTIIIAVYRFIATFFVILHYDWVMALIAFLSAPFLLLMSFLWLLSTVSAFLKRISTLSTVFSLGFESVINRISTKLGIAINNDIQADIFDKIVDADWLEISKYANGDVLNRFNGDIGTVSGNAISWLPTIIIAVYRFIATFFVILHYDWVMALIAFLSAPFLLLMSRFMIRRQREYSKKVREMSSNLMSFEVEAFYNFDTIKSFGIAPYYSKKMRWWQGLFKDISLKYNLFTIKTNIVMSILGSAVEFTAFGYCLFRLWTHDITYGTMTLFLQQRSNLSGAFGNVISIIPSFLNSSVSAHRIRELVELPKEVHIPESAALDPLAKDGFRVQMHGVEFSYIEGNKVITRSEFQAAPGEIVALVGPSGEGKTTMIRLILGLIRPQEGETVIIASNGKTVPMNAETRHLFAYVPQGNTILSGTIAENMRMVKEDATDEEIIEALKISCAWDFVQHLPDTINSRVGERGRGFSEGQSQRLAIARAVLRDAPVLLLDEATSALDVTTERNVLRNIIRQRPNKTCIVTTHRPSVLGLCQRVYRVMNGTVTELDGAEGAKMVEDF